MAGVRSSISLLAILGLASAQAPTRTAPRLFFQKGVNFTVERPDGYSSAKAREMVDRLAAEYGVNSIALVPYGFAPRDTPAVRFGGRNIWESDESIVQIAAYAHSKRVRVFLKPQVWVRGSFPGDLDFSRPEDRRTWFAEYRKFLEHYAGLAARIGADLFAVGVEFGKLSRHEKEWRELISCAREIYKGPLVYAAVQGSEFENLRFWDALDYIGLNNYYPLPDSLDTTEMVRKVEEVQRRFGKPVIFPEAGFSSFEAPHREPWDETPRKLSPADQARAYEAILRAFYGKPWFYGMYWWKVGTNGYGGPSDGSHTPWGKPAMDIVRKWYTGSKRS
jgi:hypothetical protein